MVLAIRHRIAYYKRFELDIWGIMKSTPLLVPKYPYSKIYTDYKDYYSLKNFLFFKNHKYAEFLKTLNIAIPWVFKSLKMKRILNFFFSIYNEIEERRKQAKNRYIYRIDLVKPRIFRKNIKYDFVSIRLTKLFYLTLTYKQFRRISFEMRRRDGHYGYNYCLAIEGRLIAVIYRSSFVANLFNCIQLVKGGFVAVNHCFQNKINYKVLIAEIITFEFLTKKIIYLTLIRRLASKASVFNAPRYMFVSYMFLFAYMKRPPLETDLVFPVGVDMYRATNYAY